MLSTEMVNFIQQSLYNTLINGSFTSLEDECLKIFGQEICDESVRIDEKRYIFVKGDDDLVAQAWPPVYDNSKACLDCASELF